MFELYMKEDWAMQSPVMEFHSPASIKDYIVREEGICDKKKMSSIHASIRAISSKKSVGTILGKYIVKRVSVSKRATRYLINSFSNLFMASVYIDTEMDVGIASSIDDMRNKSRSAMDPISGNWYDKVKTECELKFNVGGLWFHRMVRQVASMQSKSSDRPVFRDNYHSMMEYITRTTGHWSFRIDRDIIRNFAVTQDGSTIITIPDVRDGNSTIDIAIPVVLSSSDYIDICVDPSDRSDCLYYSVNSKDAKILVQSVETDAQHKERTNSTMLRLVVLESEVGKLKDKVTDLSERNAWLEDQVKYLSNIKDFASFLKDEDPEYTRKMYSKFLSLKGEARFD